MAVGLSLRLFAVTCLRRGGGGVESGLEPVYAIEAGEGRVGCAEISLFSYHDLCIWLLFTKVCSNFDFL